MRKPLIMKKLIFGFAFVLLIGIILDILVRIFYCRGVNLSFSSQEFSNIASPFISFFGFIGLIITVRITSNQFKLQQSASYFDYYRQTINKILQEKRDGDETMSTIELLKFVLYCNEKYEVLKKFPEYLPDLVRFKNGEDVSSSGKNYDIILGNVRLFRTKLSLLLKRYEILMYEIRDHKQLDNSHKELLLRELFMNQITEYTTGLAIIDLQPDLIEMKENLFIAFINYSKEILPFFNSDLYALNNIIKADDRFNKYLDSKNAF